MSIETVLLLVVPTVASAFLTAVVRKHALSRGILDVPNERSSHALPTPRGGGIAIVLTSCVAWLVLAGLGRLQTDLVFALATGGIAVAAVGFVDDRRPLSPGVRLVVHIVAALFAVAYLGPFPAFQIAAHVIKLGWGAHVLSVAVIVWALNLFNFMDGIDGIAASEALFIAWAGALLAVIAGSSGGIAPAAIVLGASCLGFLFWNWPTAKIFMGDVGSGYLGYAMAVLALAAAREHASMFIAWLLLAGVFVVDATVTLVRRIAHGEPPHVAHRSHAYQWLARRWQSHKRVTLLVWLVNIAWLLPCAIIAMARPPLAVWVMMIALAPIAVAALAVGAGRNERTS